MAQIGLGEMSDLLLESAKRSKADVVRPLRAIVVDERKRRSKSLGMDGRAPRLPGDFEFAKPPSTKARAALASGRLYSMTSSNRRARVRVFTVRHQRHDVLQVTISL
jgi:hypothetical protein